jgi:hypothetical protein
MVGVIGKAIKGFGKALKSRGRKPGVFDKPYKGAKENLDKIYKKPKGKFSTFPSEIVRTLKRGVVDRNVKSKEVKKLLEKSKARSKEKAGWGAHLKRRSRVFKEGQERHKALDIKEGKK